MYARLPVSPRPPRFLVEALEALRHLPVHDEPHVLLVDAHAERGRRDNDVVARLVGEPFPLTGFAVEGAEAGVVGGCADVVATESGGERFAVFAEGRVDDAADGVEAVAFGEELGFAGGVGGAAVVDGLQPGEEVGEVVGLVGLEADLVM